MNKIKTKIINKPLLSVFALILIILVILTTYTVRGHMGLKKEIISSDRKIEQLYQELAKMQSQYDEAKINYQQITSQLEIEKSVQQDKTKELEQNINNLYQDKEKAASTQKKLAEKVKQTSKSKDQEVTQKENGNYELKKNNDNYELKKNNEAVPTRKETMAALEKREDYDKDLVYSDFGEGKDDKGDFRIIKMTDKEKDKEIKPNTIGFLKVYSNGEVETITAEDLKKDE